jgi:hypothetical protein
MESRRRQLGECSSESPAQQFTPFCSIFRSLSANESAQNRQFLTDITVIRIAKIQGDVIERAGVA